MALSFGFFTDAALTAPVLTLPTHQKSDGSSGPQDVLLYLGSPVANRKLMMSSNPGNIPLVLSVVSLVETPHHALTEIKLATTLGGLDSAGGGAPLALGNYLLSGAPNAQPIYMRINDSTHTAGTLTELGIRGSFVEEVFP